MHELAVCERLIEKVSALAVEHQAARVTRIVLQVGPLSGIEAIQLAQAFSIARCGTVAQEAELEIQTSPIVVFCPRCDIETEAAVNYMLCARCGGWQVEIKSGTELILKSMQMLAG
ncbi:MAG: hydrogenase maturation nickel metallochaperone HypA [Alphaproteobacteria bacterium]|nr:hydrogenase maturation nickel metallochaperone HypA [Alphaproteobacteria bacterium]